jgi:threonine aldolase
MRQIGILGAAGIHAVQYHRDNLTVDHYHATTFARMIEKQTHVGIVNSSGTIDTNIVIIDCGESPLSATIQAACAKEGLLLSSGRGNYLRAVFYRDITINDVNDAVDIFCSCYTKLKSGS